MSSLRIHKIQKFLRLARRLICDAQLRRNLTSNFSYTINDGFFWDEYVKCWDESGNNKQLKYLGNEWINEEIFLSLLKKYSAKDKEALEIGCGGGRITSLGVQLLKHVYAADISKEMLRKCKESVNVENLSFSQIDGFTLNDFVDESMDFIYSHDVFVHFSSLQVYPYFKEIKRVLKNDGIGLVSFHNFIVHFDNFKELSLEFWQQRRFPTHMRNHFITEEILRYMLQDLNMEILEVEKKNFLIVAFRK